MTSTGLPAEGFVLVAGAVAMPTVTLDAPETYRKGALSPGTTSSGPPGTGRPLRASASSAGWLPNPGSSSPTAKVTAR
jgi:hypothetical protein